MDSNTPIVEILAAPTWEPALYPIVDTGYVVPPVYVDLQLTRQMLRYIAQANGGKPLLYLLQGGRS